MNDDLTDEERSAQVRGALFKALAVVAVIGLLIFIGTTIMVRALDLDEGDTGPVGAEPEEPATPLPTTALPSPGKKGDKKGGAASGPAKPRGGQAGTIELAITPVLARPMERVNLTGTYKGADNQELQVQRFESGEWKDFGVQATVRVGTFETFIMTGRSGEHRFRVYDPQADESSNVVLVTID